MESPCQDQHRGGSKSSLQFVFSTIATVVLALEEEGIARAFKLLIRSMRDGINYVALAKARPFVYNADAYAGLVFLFLCLIVIPLVGDYWLRHFANKVWRRIAFVGAILISAWFRLF
jgi:hypothetical protein